MRQLSFKWPAQVSLEAQDYFVSASNETAFKMVTSPALWPEGKLVLVGPEGSGKSHLARILAKDIHAEIIDAARVTADHPLPQGPVIVEDADHLPHDCEEWLFHTHNALRGRAPLLFTARYEPARWSLALPDLASRMVATTPIHIGAPDDALMTAVLMKLFNDRQIAPDPELPAYLAQRLERSMSALAQAVEALDTRALALQRPLNRRLASDWLCGRI